MVALDEAIVKLTELAKERMRDGFGKLLGMKILARALREGRFYTLGSGYFVEYGDIGLLLRSRLTAHYHYVITTVLNSFCCLFFRESKAMGSNINTT